MSSSHFQKRLFWPAALSLVPLVALYYFPVSHNGFVNWDDVDCISGNSRLRAVSIQNLVWIFTTFHSGNWMPLTWLSWAINYQMGGVDPRGYHLTNVALHAFNTLLVFLLCLRILERALGQGAAGNSPKISALASAWMTALLFGLHPIHVESVAWATERKDLLYSFFYLSALLLYLAKPGTPARRALGSAGCLALYALSLMSKPMAVTLPLVLLILDFWPLGRFPRERFRCFVEKIPYFVLALAAGWMAVASHRDSLGSVGGSTQPVWILNAFRSIFFYLWKMALPLGLSPLYPFPRHPDGLYQIENLMAVAGVVLVSLACYRFRISKPFLTAAWLYYLVSLAPVLGVLQNGYQAAADRYTYLPSLGLFFLFSTGAVSVLSKHRYWLGGFVIVLSALLGFGTLNQIGVWKNSESLWERVVRLYPGDSAIAYTYLGGTYTEDKRWDEAMAAIQQALNIPPPLSPTYQALGRLLLYRGRVQEAVQSFNTAIQLDPNQPLPHESLWSVDERLGKHEEAISQIQEAIRLDPENPEYQCNLGVSYSFLGEYPEAELAFQKACRLDPHSSLYAVNLATVMKLQGRPGEALAIYRNKIDEGDLNPVYFLKMADIDLDQNLPQQALECLRKAMVLNPLDPKILTQIAEDYERAGQKGLAQYIYGKIQSRPDIK